MFVPSAEEGTMFEVVEADTREGGFYLRDYEEAVLAAANGLGGETFEVWKVADDESRTRVLLMATVVAA